jgi:oleate hydratase
MTIGSLTENSDNGDHHAGEARMKAGAGLGPVAAHRREGSGFGRPDVFGAHIPETKWASASITTLDARIPAYVEKIAKRNPSAARSSPPASSP